MCGRGWPTWWEVSAGSRNFSLTNAVLLVRLHLLLLLLLLRRRRRRRRLIIFLQRPTPSSSSSSSPSSSSLSHLVLRFDMRPRFAVIHQRRLRSFSVPFVVVVRRRHSGTGIKVVFCFVFLFVFFFRFGPHRGATVCRWLVRFFFRYAVGPPFLLSSGLRVFVEGVADRLINERGDIFP